MLPHGSQESSTSSQQTGAPPLAASPLSQSMPPPPAEDAPSLQPSQKSLGKRRAVAPPLSQSPSPSPPARKRARHEAETTQSDEALLRGMRQLSTTPSQNAGDEPSTEAGPAHAPTLEPPFSLPEEEETEPEELVYPRQPGQYANTADSLVQAGYRYIYSVANTVSELILHCYPLSQ